jgi:hypothetical protein
MSKIPIARGDITKAIMKVDHGFLLYILERKDVGGQFD